MKNLSPANFDFEHDFAEELGEDYWELSDVQERSRI
jgi:hypothetical protein